MFYPIKKVTHRVGIIPNIEVRPSILGVRQVEDEVQDRALTYIKTKK